MKEDSIDLFVKPRPTLLYKAFARSILAVYTTR